MANFMRKIKRNNKKNKKINIGSFDPELDLDMFFNLFSAKMGRLQELKYKLLSLSKEEISTLLNDKQRAMRFVEYLYEDDMFNETTWRTIKEYTKIMNKIGGVLLPKEVEDMFEKEELKKYYEFNLELYLHINSYYRLFLRDGIIVPLLNQQEGASLSFKDKKGIIQIIFHDFEKFYKDFMDISVNIDKDVISEYITNMATEKSNKFIGECLEKKHNSKMFFKHGQNVEKQLSLSNEEIYKEAKKILDLKF